MSLPVMLDVAIGVIGLYLGLSALASTVLEWYAAALNRPGKLLRWGIARLLNDPKLTRIAGDFYDHPLIRGLSGDAYPSQIDPGTAADVLVDLLEQSGSLTGQGADRLFKPLVAKANGKRDELLKVVADWFEKGVQRLNGVAARRSHAWLLLIGALLAVGLNIDSIKIVGALASQEALRQTMAKAAETTLDHFQASLSEQAVGAATGASPDAQGSGGSQDEEQNDQALEDQALEDAQAQFQDALSFLRSTYALLPIGWSDGIEEMKAVAKQPGAWVGWALTAVAVSMGAQFWYRLLGSLMRLRGGAPAEKKDA